jgi:hypothetical protein
MENFLLTCVYGERFGRVDGARFLISPNNYGLQLPLPSGSNPERDRILRILKSMVDLNQTQTVLQGTDMCTDPWEVQISEEEEILLPQEVFFRGVSDEREIFGRTILSELLPEGDFDFARVVTHIIRELEIQVGRKVHHHWHNLDGVIGLTVCDYGPESGVLSRLLLESEVYRIAHSMFPNRMILLVGDGATVPPLRNAVRYLLGQRFPGKYKPKSCFPVPRRAPKVSRTDNELPPHARCKGRNDGRGPRWRRRGGRARGRRKR